MDKILFLNEKDRNTGLSLEHSDYRYNYQAGGSNQAQAR